MSRSADLVGVLKLLGTIRIARTRSSNRAGKAATGCRTTKETKSSLCGYGILSQSLRARHPLPVSTKPDPTLTKA